MKRPGINIWISVWLILGLFNYFFLAVWCVRDAFFTPSDVLEKFPDKLDTFYIHNFIALLLSVVLLAVTLTILPLLFMQKRFKWIWKAVFSLLGLSAVGSLMSIGPATIILLLIIGALAYFWQSPVNKSWYQLTYRRK